MQISADLVIAVFLFLGQVNLISIHHWKYTWSWCCQIWKIVWDIVHIDRNDDCSNMQLNGTLKTAILSRAAIHVIYSSMELNGKRFVRLRKKLTRTILAVHAAHLYSTVAYTSKHAVFPRKASTCWSCLAAAYVIETLTFKFHVLQDKNHQSHQILMMWEYYHDCPRLKDVVFCLNLRAVESQHQHRIDEAVADIARRIGNVH